MLVFIYQDYVHNNALLRRSLTGLLGHGAVAECDAADIRGGCLGAGVAALVMPGGADLYFCEKLNGPGNAAIRRYVEQGGGYLGICAGAYYACAEVRWAENDPDERIIGSRELRFYPGAARGPVYEWLEDGDISRSWYRNVMVKTESGTYPALYNGGPVFEEPSSPDTDVIGRYTGLKGEPPAMVEARIGKGKAVLCSPHIEICAADMQRFLYRHRNPSYDRETGIGHAFSEAETAPCKLLELALGRFGKNEKNRTK